MLDEGGDEDPPAPPTQGCESSEDERPLFGLTQAEANPRPKVKPDSKPAAPAAKAKAKPKPKTDRNPAAPKSKSKSKVAPEPPKAKAKSKVAPKPPKGGGQRKPPRGVRDYQKRLEKEAAAKEAEDGTAMDTSE
eukprot:jgi/Tetstr1/447467/TSEL_003724.t1